MTVELCIHIANLLYLASYLCRDILWLRVLTCCGLAFGIIFFCAQAHAMYAPASWMGIFLAVNAVQIVRVVRDRRHLKLSPRQEQVGSMLLSRFTRTDLLNALTKSMCESRNEPELLEHCEQIRLTRQQRIVRDVAFDRLSDGELVNLTVRRFWPSMKRRRSFRWRRTTEPA